MPETADIIIVGGGVIGASIAYHLAQRQAGRILLLERENLGCSSTGRSVASIDGLTLKPQAVELFAQSVAFFHQSDELLGAPCGFVRTGSIVLAGIEQTDGLNSAVAHMQAAGQDVKSLNLAELAALEPRMSLGGVAVASFAPGAGYADPALTTQAFAGAARRLGVEIRQREAVESLLDEGGRIVGVATAVGPIQAPIVIVAAGAWSGQLLHTTNIHLNLQPVCHPVVCLRRPPDFGPTHHGLVDLTTGIYARPESGSLSLLGSIDPSVGYDPIDPEFGPGYVHDEYVLWSMTRLIDRFQSLEHSEMLDGWAGIMTISPDWQPVIGGFPEVRGLYCAAGFSGQGFQISPAVGDLLAEYIMGNETVVDYLVPYLPTRSAIRERFPANQENDNFGLFGMM